MARLKNFIICLSAVGLASLVITGGAWAQRAITVAVGGDVPSMKMKDSRGGLSGFEIDMMKAVAEEGAFDVKFVEAPWNKLFDGLNTGKYDAVIASVSITPGRKDRFEVSEPYFRSEQLLVVHKSKADKSISGRNVGVFRLSQAADKIRRSGANLTYYTVQETPQAFKELEKGSIDAILCDSPVALGYTTDRKSSSLCISEHTNILEPSLRNEYYGIVCKKGNREVIDLIDKGLAGVKSKKIDDRLVQRWFKDGLETIASGKPRPLFASEIPTGVQNSPVPPK
jgi:polar amino acid transport system substrate-binding protein